MSHPPVTLSARNAQELRGVARLDSIFDERLLEGNISLAPIMFHLDRPTECCIFGPVSGDSSVIENVIQSSQWLMEAWMPLEEIARAMVNFKMPQQLLTINQSVYLTFIPRGECVDISVYYGARNLDDAALGSDVIAFSWALQRVAALVGKQVGGYYATVAQAQITRTAGESRDPYASQEVRPYEIEQEGLIEELHMMHSEGAVVGYEHHFTKKVLGPIFSARNALLDVNNPYRFDEARAHIRACRASDIEGMCLAEVARMEDAQ